MIEGMRAPTPTQPMNGAIAVAFAIPIQAMIVSGSLLMPQATPERPLLLTVGPSISSNPSGPKIGGLKLEMPRKHSGS